MPEDIVVDWSLRYPLSAGATRGWSYNRGSTVLLIPMLKVP